MAQWTQGALGVNIDLPKGQLQGESKFSKSPCIRVKIDFIWGKMAQLGQYVSVGAQILFQYTRPTRPTCVQIWAPELNRAGNESKK